MKIYKFLDIYELNEFLKENGADKIKPKKKGTK